MTKTPTTDLDQSQGDNDSGAADSDLALTEGDGDNAQAMPEIHEGKRLEQLLEVNRYEKKEFADAIGVTKQAVQQWFGRPSFSPAIWQKITTGLRALRLNPADIRPERYIPEETTEDLTRLVESWSRVQLSVLKRILESDVTPRRVLLAYVDGALRDKE